MEVIDKLAWIEIVNRRVLSSRSRGKSVFYIPGGKREEAESDSEALIREVYEELNVNLIESTIEYVGTFTAQAHGHAEGVLVNMTCYSARYEGILNPSGEIEELAWLTHKDRDRSSPVDHLILDWLYDQGRIEP